MNRLIFKSFLIFTLLLVVFNMSAQEKLKGNKIVVTEGRNVYNFNTIEVKDNIDVVLSQGNETSVAVETDENLQEAVITEVYDSILTIKLSNKITRKKALTVLVTVDSYFKELITKDKADVKGTNALSLDSFTINAEGNSKISLKIDAVDFYLNNNESANLNVSVKAEEVYIRANKTGKSKIKTETETLEVISQGNSTTELSGKCDILNVKSENKSDVKASELECNEITVNASDNSDLYLNASKEIIITAVDSSEIYIYNSPTVTIEKFADVAILRKK